MEVTCYHVVIRYSTRVRTKESVTLEGHVLPTQRLIASVTGKLWDEFVLAGDVEE